MSKKLNNYQEPQWTRYEDSYAKLWLPYRCDNSKEYCLIQLNINQDALCKIDSGRQAVKSYTLNIKIKELSQQSTNASKFLLKHLSQEKDFDANAEDKLDQTNELMIRYKEVNSFIRNNKKYINVQQVVFGREKVEQKQCIDHQNQHHLESSPGKETLDRDTHAPKESFWLKFCCCCIGIFQCMKNILSCLGQHISDEHTNQAIGQNYQELHDEFDKDFYFILQDLEF